MIEYLGIHFKIHGYQLNNYSNALMIVGMSIVLIGLGAVLAKSISEEELIVQIHFQSDPLLGPDDLNVTVNAVAKNDKVIKLLNYLDKYNQKVAP